SFCLCYSPLALRAILAFPTRRSSDLGHFRTSGRRRVASELCRCESRKDRHGNGFRPNCCSGGRETSMSRNGPESSISVNFRCVLDRKSTRLNSSHEWISYAVFFLKKK